jgi:uncharacterized protein (DUF1697 family)
MRVVGLLRGVNVGGHNRLKMADLRAVVESLGHADVATYLQSGNVVFTMRDPVTSAMDNAIGAAISSRLTEMFGLRVNVLTRTGAEMASIVDANPYRRDDPTKVVVTFLGAPGRPPDPDVAAFAPEGLTVHGREVYFDLPFGQARSPMLAALAKATTDDPMSTSRNWRTVLALAEMSSG